MLWYLVTSPKPQRETFRALLGKFNTRIMTEQFKNKINLLAFLRLFESENEYLFLLIKNEL